MKTGQASRTAEYMAFFRALESARSPRKRLFADSFAMQFLRPGLRRAVYFSRVPVLGALIPRYLDRRLPGARTSGVARTRLIDDALCQALREGIGQVLILGAGFDCRAYRLPGISSAAVFEVDHPATLSVKRAHLCRVLANVPENVRFVEMDFDRQSLSEALTQAGFDLLRPTVFVWEGVTNYLSADSVSAVLRFVAGCAASSRLVFTYVDRRALDGSALFEGAADLMRDVARLGEPWTFGLDPEELPEYLRALGLRLERDAGAREYRVQYFGPDGERMKGYDFYHVAIARVAMQGEEPPAGALANPGEAGARRRSDA